MLVTAAATAAPMSDSQAAHSPSNISFLLPLEGQLSATTCGAHAVSVTSARERRYARLTQTPVKLSICTIPVRKAGLIISAGAKMAYWSLAYPR